MKPLIVEPWIRAAAALAFAVHPIHCEPVAGLVGRAELGMALHVLLALLAYGSYLEERDGLDAMNDDDNVGGRCVIESQPETTREWTDFQCVLQALRRVPLCWSAAGNTENAGNAGNANANGTVHQCQKQSPGEGRTTTMRCPPPVASQPAGACTKWRRRLLLAAALTAAATAVLWKETGIVAIPLCVIMELTWTHFTEPATMAVRCSAVFNQVRYESQLIASHQRLRAYVSVRYFSVIHDVSPYFDAINIKST